MNAPKIELKRFTYNERLSEETYCYAADVYVDGVFSFTAENRGHGGCDLYRPAGSRVEGGALTTASHAFDTAMAKLKAYAASLPAEECYGQSIQPDVESLITDCVTAKLEERDAVKLAKKMATRVYFLDNGLTYSYDFKRAVTQADVDRIIAKELARGHTIEVLNPVGCDVLAAARRIIKQGGA